MSGSWEIEQLGSGGCTVRVGYRVGWSRVGRISVRILLLYWWLPLQRRSTRALCSFFPSMLGPDSVWGHFKCSPKAARICDIFGCSAIVLNPGRKGWIICPRLEGQYGSALRRSWKTPCHRWMILGIHA